MMSGTWWWRRPIAAEGYYENTLKLLAMLVMSGNWWSPAAVSAGCTSQTTPLCTDGGYLDGLDLKLGGLGRGAGAQSLSVKGTIFFPQGAPPTDGAQLLLEDVGNGDAEVFELSWRTAPVPPPGGADLRPA